MTGALRNELRQVLSSSAVFPAAHACAAGLPGAKAPTCRDGFPKGRPGLSIECKAEAHLLPGLTASTVRRGSAAMRATSLTGRRAGRRARPVLFGAALVALAATAHAGGLDHVAEPVDPCPPIVHLDTSSMTAGMLRQFGAIRAMSCGQVHHFDRATGLALSDEEKLRRVFNGARVPAPDPAVIPGPGALASLLAGLAVLGGLAVRRRRG